ncbi:ABC transporter permease subunit [Candidatus Amarobacter glycogenicus]|uniref:ABC transporter permease subunit n=1 Tax=Candidatus Amarobacter glycogenicus TaxID=3140699 RepID=UPI0031CC966E
MPYELEEAAKVFGCTPFQAFRQVVFPLVLPGIAASAIFTFVMSWNEVFAASVLTIQHRTLPAQVFNHPGTIVPGLPICRARFYADPVDDLHLYHSALFVQYVGSDHQVIAH